MIISIDPGALRCGIAVLSDKTDQTKILHSEIFGLKRENLAYQDYKVKITSAFAHKAVNLIREFSPSRVVCEMIPIRGYGDIGQPFLASTAATAIIAIAASYDIPSYQISAISVKKTLTGKGKATKVAIRKKILELYPELSIYSDEFKTIYDRVDAIAIGVAYLTKEKIGAPK